MYGTIISELSEFSHGANYSHICLIDGYSFQGSNVFFFES